MTVGHNLTDLIMSLRHRLDTWPDAVITQIRVGPDVRAHSVNLWGITDTMVKWAVEGAPPPGGLSLEFHPADIHYTCLCLEEHPAQVAALQGALRAYEEAADGQPA